MPLAVELEGVTGKIDGGFERKAVGTEGFEAEFAGVALGGDGKSQEQEGEDEVESGAHFIEWGNLYAISFVVAKILTRDSIPAFALVLLRVLFAAPLFWLTALAFVREKTDRKDIPKFIMLAVFGVIINQTFFIKGLSLTSPISAAPTAASFNSRSNSSASSAAMEINSPPAVCGSYRMVRTACATPFS